MVKGQPFFAEFTSGTPPFRYELRETNPFLDAHFPRRVSNRACARNTDTNSFELIVFNTLIPQDHPTNSQRFSLLPRYYDRRISMHIDEDRFLGTLDRDGPFITDPTQAILVVKFSKFNFGDVFLVVRIQPLIEWVCPTSTDGHMPRDEWKRNSVILESPALRYRLKVYVHGTHLVVLGMANLRVRGSCPRVRTFDLGRRGCGALPLWDEGSGAERKAFFDGCEFILAEAARVRAVTPWLQIGPQGDGNPFQVSYLSNPAATVP